MEQEFYEARLLCDVMRPEASTSSSSVNDGRGSGSYVPLEVCIEESSAIVSLLKSIDTVFQEEDNEQMSLPEFSDNVLHSASTNFYLAQQQLTGIISCGQESESFTSRLLLLFFCHQSTSRI